MIYNINDIRFFTETMKVIQRGNYDFYEKLINILDENPNENSEELNLILIEKINYYYLENLIQKETITHNELKDIFLDIKETKLCDESWFSRYIKNYQSKNIDNFEIYIDNLFDTLIPIEENYTLPTAIINIQKILNIISLEINQNSKGREKFSLDRKNLQYIPWVKTIFNQINNEEFEENAKIIVIDTLKHTYDTFVEKYSTNHLDFENMTLIEQIEIIGDEIQKNAQIFNDFKLNRTSLDKKAKILLTPENLSNLNKFRILQGKGDKAGSDLKFRFTNKYKEFFINNEERNNFKKFKRGMTRKIKQNLKKEFSNNDIFKKNLRKLISSIYLDQNKKYESSNKRLFIDENIFGLSKFALNKEVISNIFNITFNTTRNLEVVKIMCNIVHNENHNEKIDNFLNKYPTFTPEMLEDEFLKVLNYSIYSISQFNKIKSKLDNNQPINVKNYDRFFKLFR